MTVNGSNSNPISDDHRALCGALDRLLTIGSYYQPSHERFQAVAKECQKAVIKSAGKRPKVEIFVNAKGIIIDDGFMAAEEVEARRLFDLLDPLHIALVEIDGTATSDHLHLALTSLKKVRNELIGSQSYREIEIKGLPESVRTTNRSLFLKTQVREKARRKAKAKPKEDDPQVTFFDHNLISDLLSTGSDEGQKLEKEFIGIIQGIMATADPTRLKNSGEEAKDPADWLPEEAIGAIKNVLDSLAGTSNDLMNLQHLIAQAQTALEMTGDSQLVDLVFSRLQKDSKKLARKRVQPKMIGKDQRGVRIDSRKKLIMSQDEMRAIVDSLEIPNGPMTDPMEQAGADCLAICIQVLDLAPTEELVTGTEETLLRLITTQNFSQTKRETLIDALRAIFNGTADDLLERVWPMIWGPLRRTHPELLQPIWLSIWQELTSRGRDRAWPYLVNDLLLGMPSGDRIQRLILLEALSQVNALGKHDIRVVLENLPALLQGTVDDQFFNVPPPLLYPVHKVLVGCSISPAFGPLLHETLVRQAPHKLSKILLDIMDEYNPINRAIYHTILDQGINEALTEDMLELAPEVIEEALSDLHWDYMEEDWVCDSITWLGHLGHESALNILAEILNEKKYVVLNGWPLAARESALAARTELRERLGYKGRQDDPDEAAEDNKQEEDTVNEPNDQPVTQ